MGLSQAKIHTNLEPILVKTFSDLKNNFHPHYKLYEQSLKTDDDIIALGNGFSTIMDVLFKTAYTYLLDVEILFSKSEILNKLETQKNNNKNPSKYFTGFYKYAQLNLSAKRESLARYLALEAISRYGKNLMLNLYSGNRHINDQWRHYITSTYFGLWQIKTNINAFRMVSEELQYINSKHKTNFFPAKVLRTHDDTVDGQIIHALSFGWYQSAKKLSQVAVMTSDPFDKVISRVQQYQSFLAYSQNPVSLFKKNIPPRVQHTLKPGILYHLNMAERLIRCVEFEPAKVIVNNDLVEIQATYSDVSELRF